MKPAILIGIVVLVLMSAGAIAYAMPGSSTNAWPMMGGPQASPMMSGVATSPSIEATHDRCIGAPDE